MHGDGQVQRARDEIVLGDCGAFKNPDHRAVIKHQYPVATADQLVVVGRVKQDRGALVGQPANTLVELLLGADVDAASWVVEKDDARLGHQPFADDHFLLIAAGQSADRTVGAVTTDLQNIR